MSKPAQQGLDIVDRARRLCDATAGEREDWRGQRSYIEIIEILVPEIERLLQIVRRQELIG